MSRTPFLQKILRVVSIAMVIVMDEGAWAQPNSAPSELEQYAGAVPLKMRNNDVAEFISRFSSGDGENGQGPAAGKINKWQDPLLVTIEDNHGRDLPAGFVRAVINTYIESLRNQAGVDIEVVARSEGRNNVSIIVQGLDERKFYDDAGDLPGVKTTTGGRAINAQSLLHQPGARLVELGEGPPGFLCNELLEDHKVVAFAVLIKFPALVDLSPALEERKKKLIWWHLNQCFFDGLGFSRNLEGTHEYYSLLESSFYSVRLLYNKEIRPGISLGGARDIILRTLSVLRPQE